MVKLYEYEGKALFKRYGIPVPDGQVVKSADELTFKDFPVALKSQVLVGGRGKAGGIKFAENETEAKQKIEELLRLNIHSFPVRKVLIEKKIQIDKEIYISITLDRSARLPVILASGEGGVDIEDVSEDKLFKQQIHPLIGIAPYITRKLTKKLELEKTVGAQVISILQKLYEIFRKEDAELVEINPLVISNDAALAGDAKVIIEDDALFRHPEYRKISDDLTDIERRAREKDIAFIQLDGDIGVIANGAGLTMATLDSLLLHGGKPGVFLDLGGTDDPEKVKQAFILMKDAHPKAIFVNIFGGITKCDTVAKGIVDAMQCDERRFPTVARIKGVNEDDAKRILTESGFVFAESLDEGSKAAVRLREMNCGQ